MSNRINIIDVPADSRLMTGLHQWKETWEAAHRAWVDFSNKWLPGVEDVRLFANNELQGLAIRQDVPLPKGWRWIKPGIIAPQFSGNKEAYNELKALPKKPTNWDLTTMCGMEPAMNPAEGIVSFLSFHVLPDERIIFSLPVGPDGSHYPIPEGARELTVTEFMKMTHKPAEAPAEEQPKTDA